jgi:hypothetical protein
MTVTVGSFTCSALTAQPFAYEGEARSGLTARTFVVSGLLTPVQWKSLVDVYNAWRDLRITDEDTAISGVVGTTIAVTITPANGLSISSLACWFAEPPSGTQTGAYVAASVLMVDAAQALQVLLRGAEKADPEIPSLGTVTLTRASGTSPVITLLEPMDTRQDGPQVALTATGVSYITGPLVAHKARQIRGHLTTGNYTDVLSWYDETVVAVPAATSWFPITAPSATAEVYVTGGVKSTRYTVSLTALQIL